MRPLIAFDRSLAARAAIRTAAALFAPTEAVVVTVRRPPLEEDREILARLILPEDLARRGMAEVERRIEEDARATVEEGVKLVGEHGMRAEGVLVAAARPWRVIAALATEHAADVVVCGAHGRAPLGGGFLGSTATSLLQCARLPVLVIPPGFAHPSDAVIVGYDGSPAAKGALRFAAEHLPQRRALIAYAWCSPVRHEMQLNLMHHLPPEVVREFVPAVDAVYGDAAEKIAREGVQAAEALGMAAHARAIESADSPWRALLHLAARERANVIVAGCACDGDTTSVLGSVRSGLVHHAPTAILLVPELTTTANGDPAEQPHAVALRG